MGRWSRRGSRALSPEMRITRGGWGEVEVGEEVVTNTRRDVRNQSDGWIGAGRLTRASASLLASGPQVDIQLRDKREGLHQVLCNRRPHRPAASGVEVVLFR